MSGNSYFSDPDLSNLLDEAELAIFDMNGLIVDDEPIQLQSMNMALTRFGVTIKKDYWIERCVGRSVEVIGNILSDHGILPGDYSIQDFIAVKRSHYRELMVGNVRNLARKGVQDLINYLSGSSNHKLAIATSASKGGMDIVLGEMGLDLKGKFDYVVCGEDVTHSKPNPEIYLKVSEISGIQVSKCLVFEDSSAGVNAAFNAGMKSIAVPNVFTLEQDFSNVTHVVDNMTRNAKISKS